MMYRRSILVMGVVTNMIQDIEFVYASVATGEWTLAEFEAWCERSRRVATLAYTEGYDEGCSGLYAGDFDE